VLVDQSLPAQEFVDCQFIAVAGILEAEEPATHGGNDLSFSADNPTLGVRRRKVCDC
jgi:hypothetical protein